MKPERPKKLRSWRLAAAIGLVLFAAGLLGYLLYREREVLFSYPWQIRPLPLLAAFLLFTIGQWLAAVVWVWIMRSLGAKIDLLNHLNYFFISRLAKRLPGTVWYVAYLAQMYKNEGFSPWLTSLASVIELVVTVVSGIPVSLLFALNLLGRYPLGGLGAALLTLGCLVFLHPRFIRWLLRRFGGQAQPPPYTSLLKWVGIYVVIRLLSGGIVFSAINIIYPIPLETLPYITGAWAVVGVLSTLLILSISNLGFTEVSLSLLLTDFLPSSIAVIVSVGLRILFILFEVFDALVILAANALRRKKKPE